MRSPAFAEVFREWRQRSGLTLRRVAKAAGVTHPVVAEWERGARTAPLPRLNRLDRAFGFTGELARWLHVNHCPTCGQRLPEAP